MAALNLNTSFHISIGYIPFESTFGRKPVLTGCKLTTKDIELVDLYVKLMRQQLDIMGANAITSISEAKTSSRPYFNLEHRTRTFAPGELVLMKIGGRRPKLAPIYSVPLEVTDRKEDKYKLKSLNSDR